MYQDLFTSPSMSSGINRMVYNILGRIGDFATFFSTAGKWFAATCFLMALGMACIKIFMQACDARQELLKLGMTLITYCIMINFFPIAMQKIPKFCMELGYGAVFEGGVYDVDLKKAQNLSLKATKSDFYTWLGENTDGIFTTEEYINEQESAKTALKFNIVDIKSGFIDIEKCFKLIIAFFNIALKCFPKLSLLTLLKGDMIVIAISIIFLFAIAIFIYSFFVVMINYIMALLDYFAIAGYGILMVPLSLWDGTKNYTQALLGSIGKIMIKLIVITSLMYLSIMCIVDVFTELYINSIVVNIGGHQIVASNGGIIDGIKNLGNMALTIAFEGPILMVITKQTSSIASFLSGGDPRMSFGEWAQGAMQTAGAAAATTAAAGGAINAVQGAKSIMAAGQAAGEAAKLSGGNVAQSVLGAMAGKTGNLIGQGSQDLNKLFRASRSAMGMDGAYSSEGISGFGGGFSNGNNEGNSGSYREGNQETEGGLPVSSESNGNEGEKERKDYETGRKGVYGSIEGNETSAGNQILMWANRNSTSKNPFTRTLANDVASVAGKNTRLAAKARNVNYGGGARITYNGRSGELYHRGESQEIKEGPDGKKGTNVYRFKTDDEGFAEELKGINDNDAVNFARETTKEAEEGK